MLERRSLTNILLYPYGRLKAMIVPSVEPPPLVQAVTREHGLSLLRRFEVASITNTITGNTHADIGNDDRMRNATFSFPPKDVDEGYLSNRNPHKGCNSAAFGKPCFFLNKGNICTMGDPRENNRILASVIERGSPFSELARRILGRPQQVRTINSMVDLMPIAAEARLIQSCPSEKFRIIPDKGHARGL